LLRVKIGPAFHQRAGLLFAQERNLSRHRRQATQPLLRLPSLAPDIVTAIINGKHPSELSAKRLTRLALKLPTDWAEQRKLLGFQRQ